MMLVRVTACGCPRRIEVSYGNSQPFGRLSCVLTKPTGAACNLNCTYCFYLSKEELYPGSDFRMSAEIQEAYIRQLLNSADGPETTVAWQGGEPTLMGLEFFRRSSSSRINIRNPG